MSMRDTGMPREDAKGDFARERRRRALGQVVNRLRAEPSDVSEILPFEEVVAALGRVSQRDLGVQTIPLDSIVGTVDRHTRDFDRAFRPATTGVRGRWEGIAAARRRGQSMPPIDVLRVGELHFVQDGHHRVSVARAQGETVIDARVVEVRTAIGAGRDLLMSDLPLKAHERVFNERVPLPAAQRARIAFKDEWRYAMLANLVESWGFRASHERGHLLSREEMAVAWFREEYEPIARTVMEADIGGPGNESERYLRIALLRFLLLQTHDWSDEISARLLGEVADPKASVSAKDDTMVNWILGEMS